MYKAFACFFLQLLKTQASFLCMFQCYACDIGIPGKGHIANHSDFSSVVCAVIMIYCIVIIYIPSLSEGETNYVVSLNYNICSKSNYFIRCKGPKRCTTTLIERNVTNAFITDTKCNWSSCGEWCLSSKVSFGFMYNITNFYSRNFFH